MRGGSHFVMNAVSAGIAVDTYLLCTKTTAVPALKSAFETAVRWATNFGAMPAPVGLMLSMLGYMAGTLLPDVDTPHSPFGRYLHVNVRHRTWTHSLWFVLLFAVPSYWFRPLIWLAIGAFLHIFWDAFSVSGVHWFYPWRKGKGHLFKLYRTGEPSERVVMALGVTMVVLFTVFTIWRLVTSRMDMLMCL